MHLDEIDPQRFDAHVRQHPVGTPYHLSGFLRPAAAALGLDLRLTAVVVEGRTIGVLPLLLRHAGPAVLVNHRLPFPYLGALVEAGTDVELVAGAVRRHLRPVPVLQIGLAARAPFPVSGRRWEVTAATTFVVPVGAGVDVEAGFSRSRRKALAAARSAGLVAGPADLAEVREHLSTWTEATLRRQGLPPRLPAGLVPTIAEQWESSGHVWATAVRRDGEVLAVSVDLVLGDRVYAWVVGISDDGRSAGASIVLDVHLMHRAAEDGATTVDLLGAPTAGIADFKRSLGAEPQPYTVARRVSATLTAGTLLRAALVGAGR